MSNVLASDSNQPKRFKSDKEHDESDQVSVHDVLRDLSKFQLKRVLHNNTQKKLICFEGTFGGHEGSALVLLEKRAFVEDDLQEGFFTESTLLSKEFNNDIYGSYNCIPSVNHNGIKTTVIHPATEKHIAKYEQQPIHIVDETPDVYKNVTLPYLQDAQFSLEWVYNILENKAEQERKIYEDLDPINGFVIIPDLKWDLNMEALYLLAIIRQRGIKSIRDLNESHLPLLKNVRDAGTKAIISKYGGPPASQLRIYLHYQPSFYHLHVHFTYLRHEAPGIFTEKAHLLSAVINNIELMSDYYSKATLSFVVKETDALYNGYQRYKSLPGESLNGIA